MRLNKYLAHATGMSRRDADAAIAAGRVFVNTTRAILGTQVNEKDAVFFDHKPVHATETHIYIALNKPVGYLCSRRSQGGVPTIFELLPEKYRPLKPVGRLDKDSSGLILLTDDGDFAHRMTHPSFHKVKSYEVELDKPLEPLHQQMISDHGISLEDGVSQLIIEKVQASEVPAIFSEEHLQPKSDLTETVSDSARSRSEGKHSGDFYVITMHEGRNRQIRRTFAALGYTVTKLHRTTFGNYSLGDIKTGEYLLVDIR